MKLEIEKGKKEIKVTDPIVKLELSFEEAQALAEVLAHVGGRINMDYLNNLSRALSINGFIYHKDMTQRSETGTSLYFEEMLPIVEAARKLKEKYSELIGDF